MSVTGLEKTSVMQWLSRGNYCSLEGHTQSYLFNYDSRSGSLMINAVMRVMTVRNPI